MAKSVGIDLGTINSVVAVMEGRQPTVIIRFQYPTVKRTRLCWDAPTHQPRRWRLLLPSYPCPLFEKRSVTFEAPPPIRHSRADRAQLCQTPTAGTLARAHRAADRNPVPVSRLKR
jgi:hypothetical protein